MQVMFLVLFGVSLVFFSFLVNDAVQMIPYLLDESPIPGSLLLWASVWLALFLVTFIGTGFFLYERERDEGRIARRIGLYEWVLNARRSKTPKKDSAPKPIRRA